MARLPYVDLTQAPEPVKELLSGLAPLNIFRMLAHAERNVRGFLQLGGTILGRQQLDARLRELVILRVACLSKAEYEWVQHVSIAAAVGASEAQIEAIKRGDTAAACFDERERLVLRFTDELLRDVRVSDATFAAAAAVFPPREVVELILAVGFYMLVARLLETTGVDIEPPPATSIVDQLNPKG